MVCNTASLRCCTGTLCPRCRTRSDEGEPAPVADNPHMPNGGIGGRACGGCVLSQGTPHDFAVQFLSLRDLVSFISVLMIGLSVPLA